MGMSTLDAMKQYTLLMESAIPGWEMHRLVTRSYEKTDEVKRWHWTMRLTFDKKISKVTHARVLGFDNDAFATILFNDAEKQERNGAENVAGNENSDGDDDFQLAPAIDAKPPPMDKTGSRRSFMLSDNELGVKNNPAKSPEPHDVPDFALAFNSTLHLTFSFCSIQ